MAQVQAFTLRDIIYSLPSLHINVASSKQMIYNKGSKSHPIVHSWFAKLKVWSSSLTVMGAIVHHRNLSFHRHDILLIIDMCAWHRTTQFWMQQIAHSQATMHHLELQLMQGCGQRITNLTLLWLDWKKRLGFFCSTIVGTPVLALWESALVCLKTHFSSMKLNLSLGALMWLSSYICISIP